MKSRLVVSLLAAVAVVSLSASIVHAIPRYPQTATTGVPAGLTPNDLHLLFTGTGGSIKNVVVLPAVGAGTVTTPGGNRINVVWDTKLAPLDPVTITFTTEHPNIGVDGGKWTNDGDSIGVVAPVDINMSQGSPVPGASPLTMALIALVIAGAGMLMLRRRAEA